MKIVNLFFKLHNELPDFYHAARVKSDSWLIEYQNGWIVQNRRSNRNSLLHAGREVYWSYTLVG